MQHINLDTAHLYLEQIFAVCFLECDVIDNWKKCIDQLNFFVTKVFFSMVV